MTQTPPSDKSAQNSQAASSATPNAAPPVETESILKAKVETLRGEAKGLETEVKILEGRVKNRNTEKSKIYQEQNEVLEKKVKRLALALWTYYLDELKPRKAEEHQLLTEVFRKSALRYFKEAKINPDLWKSIES